MSATVSFRQDINALRALAVLLVTFYHFNLPGFSGGFLGVDIFFVISGYLMSRIVFDAHDQGRFSVMRFYWARIKRIVPALLILCAILIVGGYFLLLPSDYRLLGKHSGSSLTFISNWVYLSESGYFDVSSHDKWLLHTWSLSVEWQFYVFFPLAMAFILRYIRNTYWLSLFILAAIASYLYGAYLTANKPTAAFFLLPTRAWEMLAGGIVLLYFRQGSSIRLQTARVLTTSGAGLIIASQTLIDSQTAWPGFLAGLPVAGTMLVIAGNNMSGQSWISNTLGQAIGRWSYSIYLWHWPVVVAGSHLDLHHQIEFKIAGIVVAIMLGWISFRWVEAPTRKALDSLAINRCTLTLLASLILVFSLSAVAYLSNGLPSRTMPEAAKLADREKDNRAPPKNAEQCKDTLDETLHPCIYGDGGPIGAIVIGDSHSAALVTAVTEALASTPAPTVLNYTFNACPTVLGVEHHNKRFAACAKFNENLVNELSHLHPELPVIIINRWASYLEGPNISEENAGARFIGFKTGESDEEFVSSFTGGLTGMIHRLTETGRKVFLVLPVPEMPFNVPSQMARTAMLTKQTHDVSLPMADYQKRNKNALKILRGQQERNRITLLDPSRYLCTDLMCTGSIDGRPLYYDDDHLSEYGNKFLVPMFRSILAN